MVINPLLKKIEEDVMGFLNEIQLKYPDSISFASGRPDEHYFDIQDFSEYFNVYVDSLVSAEEKTKIQIVNSLGQYNRAKGIINEHVAKYLKRDEAIKADRSDILITVGTQEALAITLITLCDKESDIIIVEDPTYIGITHLAMIAGYQIEPVPVHLEGLCLEALEKKIVEFERVNKKVKIVYVIPDYQNPTGNSMPSKKRYELLNLANKYDFFILEDNAYGDFNYYGERPFPIKSFDVNKRVIYLRSFAKTIYPSLRLAAIVADQKINIEGVETPLSDLMAKTKGYLTVNTPSINQAVFGGMLIKNDFSLHNFNRKKISSLMNKRNQILNSLNEFMNPEKYSWAQQISWNKPNGGFFVTIKLPFEVKKDDVIICAERYKVIFTPMSFFYFDTGGEKEIRLAFSNISIDEIKTGIDYLAQYVKTKVIDNK